MKTFYKATISGKSFSRLIRTSDFALSYEVGKTTVPKIGKIFIFDNVKDAKAFIIKNTDTNSNLQFVTIFKGTGTNPKQIKLVAKSCCYFQNFWRNKRNHKHQNTYDVNESPKGTFVVDDFTPTEKYTFYNIE